MRTALAALVCVLVPGVLHAQSDVPLPRNDVTVSTGLIDAQYRQADTYDRWHGSVFGGINVGRYWTDHQKTEVEAGWLSAAQSSRYEAVTIGADRAYVESDYLFRDLKLSVSQSVQFGRNQWADPFIGAGVDIDYLRTSEDRPSQISTIIVSSRDNRSVFVPGVREREARVRAVPFANRRQLGHHARAEDENSRAAAARAVRNTRSDCAERERQQCRQSRGDWPGRRGGLVSRPCRDSRLRAGLASGGVPESADDIVMNLPHVGFAGTCHRTWPGSSVGRAYD